MIAGNQTSGPNQLTAHHQYTGSQIGIGGNTSSQYEYSIDGQIEPANVRSQAGPSSNANNLGVIKGNTIASKSSGSGAQTQSMPKRTPHSELTSY